MTEELAQTIALKALAWLSGDEDLLRVFMGSSGASIDDIREGATDPAFLASILDFISMDDAWLIRFCDRNALSYTDPTSARQLLPGGDLPNWT